MHRPRTVSAKRPATGGLPSGAPTPAVREPRQHAQDIGWALVEAGLEPIESLNFVDALVRVADELASAVPPRTAHGHHWCQLLADTADALDSSILADAAGATFTAVLKSAGLDALTAHLVGWAVAKASNALLTHLLPTAQLCLGLRVLGLLLCPDSDRCPAADRLCIPVLRALIANGQPASN